MGQIDFTSFNPPKGSLKGSYKKKVDKNKKFSSTKQSFSERMKDQKVSFEDNKLQESTQGSDMKNPRFGQSFRKYNENDKYAKNHSHNKDKTKKIGPSKSKFFKKRVEDKKFDKPKTFTKDEVKAELGF